MKETYQYCLKCKSLSPLPSYFYEPKDLHPEWRKLCVWCVEKIMKKIAEARINAVQEILL